MNPCPDPERPATKRPPPLQTLAEFRALLAPPPCRDFGALVEHLPRGEGGIVLVLPPIVTGDAVTEDFRRGLMALGWDARGWCLGINMGPTPTARRDLVATLHRLTSSGQPIRLVGFSMGGLFARYLAHAAPDRVRSVITVGSPCADPLDAAWFPLGPLVPLWGGRQAVADLARRIERPLPVPTTCLYTERDGIVGWRSCLDPAALCVPFDGAHVTMAHDATVFRHVAQALAQPPVR